MTPSALGRDGPARRRAGLALLALPLVASPLVACMPMRRDAASAAGEPVMDAVLARREGFLLLGEVHDAVALHRERLRWLQALAARQARAGAALRVVLALEQLDVDRQADLDRIQATLDAPARQRPGTARALAEAAGFRFDAWPWPSYEPVLQLALRAGWRIVATNLPAAQAMQVGRGQAAPWFDEVATPWRPEDERALQQEIRTGHCNALPERAIAPMSRAQRARDVRMAQALHQAHQSALREAGSAQVLSVFLAGNGHVRRDLGVPRHLAVLAPAVLRFSVGFLEQDPAAVGRSPESAPYDHVVLAAPQTREDPCLAFGKGRG